MFKELLPIGSVILLKGNIKKLMITGIKIAKEDEPENFYDYMGVLFPEGYVGDGSNFLFNHSEINDIVFRGYDNPERQSFINLMEEAYNANIENKQGAENE